MRVQNETDEYRGRIGEFQRCLEGDLPRSRALLERIVGSLESYVSVHTPDAAASPPDVDDPPAHQDSE